MTNILITAPSLDFSKNVSGISSVVRNIISELGDEFEFEHVQLAKIDAKTGLSALVFSGLLLLSALKQVAVAPSASILHMNLALNKKSIIRDAAVVALARVRRIPIIVHLHGGEYLEAVPPYFLRRLIEFHIKSARRVLALSNREMQQVLQHYASAEGNIGYLYNCVKIDETPRVGRQGRLRVLFAGRLETSKGLDLLLELIRRAPAGVEFSVAGQGSRRPEIESVCQDGSVCQYLGVLKGAEMRTAMRQHDVLLLPSLSGEGMPMAVVEAMVEGTIPITTSIASLPEMITDGDTGFLVSPGDVDTVERRLTELARNPDLERDLSCNAREYARDKFDRRKVLRELAHIYHDLAVYS